MAELDPSPPARSTSHDGRRLDSWKEIAAYLKRDVTTVRRWERREGLPVHRHRHTAIGSVYAFTNEIDTWQHGRERPQRADQFAEPAVVEPRLVGRDLELRRLHDHLERALGGQRQTVFVAGELGLGKTALTRTFLASVKSEVWVAAGQCVEQYGRAEPYLPILEALGRISRDDRTREVVRVVSECAPSWRDQLSHDSRVPNRRRRDVAAGPGAAPHMAGELTDVIEALAGVKPLVLLLEDLHWSDQATIEFIARLARRPEQTRLLVIGTYRPVELFESGSPLLRVARELRVHFQAEELELTQLTQDAVGELIARERTWNDLSAAAATLRQWSGNPLFLIHFLAHLERAGHITSRNGLWYLDLDRQASVIPNTLRMLIEEQLERLEPNLQRLLEIASVVGETFPASLVADAALQDVTLVERSFEDLCRRSPLVMHREATRLPNGTASAAYAFVHEFHRQVVYQQLPQATLIELHRRIGTRLEAAYGARAPEISSELAMHFDRGRELGRAVEHYRLAAENAIARNADREAQLALSRASELMAEHPDGRDRDEMEVRLRARLADVIDRLRARIPWLGMAIDEECTRLGGGPGESALVDAMIRLSWFHAVSGDLAAAKEIGDRAAAIGHLRGQALAASIAQQAYVRLLAGEFADSRALALHGLKVADTVGGGDVDGERIRSSIVLAWSAWYLGRYDELRNILARLFPKGDGTLPGTLTMSALPLLEWLGRPDRRLEVRASGAARDSSPLDAMWPANAIRGWLLTRRGRDADGVRILQETIREIGRMGLDSWLPCTFAWLAEGLLVNARIDDAIAAAEEGLSIVRRTGARSCDSELYRVRGEAMRARQPRGSAAVTKDRDAAEASFWAGITVARQQDARTLELRSTLGLCHLLCDAGRHDEAIRALVPVCEQFAATDDTPELVDARTLLGRVGGRPSSV